MPLRDPDVELGPRSGRLLLRMPRSLHERLVEVALVQDVSLNTYICTILAGAVEWQGREWAPDKVAKARNEVRRQLWRERHGVARRREEPEPW